MSPWLPAREAALRENTSGNAVFDQAKAQINRYRAALVPATAAKALPELLRNRLACLLLATAYAGFTRRSASELSLLEEGQLRLMRLRQPQLKRGPAASDADSISQLSGEEE